MILFLWLNFALLIKKLRVAVEEDLNQISYDIIGCAFKIHSALGPGLLESTYQTCLEYELANLGYNVDVQVPMPINYKELKMDRGYRLDLLVNNSVLVELKSVEAISSVHIAQILTYLKLSGKSLGLLINFNVKDLKKGIKRFVI